MVSVLVGHLNTASGRAALRTASEEAKLRSAELIVFRHVRATSEGEEHVHALREAQAETEAVAETLRAQGVSAEAYTSAGVQSAGSALVSYAHQMGVSLIVIGVRRRSAVGKALLGSDAQDILLSADCPVLAVKSAGS